LSTERIAKQDHAVREGQDVSEIEDGVQTCAKQDWGQHLWALGYFVAVNGDLR